MQKLLPIIFLAFVLVLLTAFALRNQPVLLSSKAGGINSPVSSGSLITKDSQVQGQGLEEIQNEKNKLQAAFEQYFSEQGLGNNASVYYYNLSKGYEIQINGKQSWNPASTVKAYLVVEAYRQKQLGLVNFDQRVLIKDQNVVPTELESEDYQPLRAGVKATIRELLSAMVTQSDNTAFNTLLGVLDRRNVSSTLKKLGLLDTVVGEKLNLNDGQLALDMQVPGRQPNHTTAADFGRLFVLLYQHKIYGSEEIITIFKEQKIADKLPALLPPETIIAHKTGDYDIYHHDGGIVYKPDEPYVLAVFTGTGNSQAAAQLSKVAYYKSIDVLGIHDKRVRNIFTDFGDFLHSQWDRVWRN